jgi:hypothetical protein
MRHRCETGLGVTKNQFYPRFIQVVTSEKLHRLNAGSIITAFQTEEIHANELRDV